MEENKKKKDHSDVEVGLIIASVAVLAVFIIFMVLNPTSTPVSYTHLDVYKRQSFPRCAWSS